MLGQPASMRWMAAALWLCCEAACLRLPVCGQGSALVISWAGLLCKPQDACHMLATGVVVSNQGGSAV
jgi:hypothetical protein